MDIRNFFKGLSIPPGGVRIIGGEKGDAFIAFSTDEDARQAMMMTNNLLNDNPVQLFLSSKTEMQNTIVQAKSTTPAPVTTAPPAVENSLPTMALGQQQMQPASSSQPYQAPSQQAPAVPQHSMASLSHLHGLLPPNITQALGFLANVNLNNQTQAKPLPGKSDGFGNEMSGDYSAGGIAPSTGNQSSYSHPGNFNNSNMAGNNPRFSSQFPNQGQYRPQNAFNQNDRNWEQHNQPPRFSEPSLLPSKITSNIGQFSPYDQPVTSNINEMPPFSNQSRLANSFPQSSPITMDSRSPLGAEKEQFKGPGSERSPYNERNRVKPGAGNRFQQPPAGRSNQRFESPRPREPLTGGKPPSTNQAGAAMSEETDQFGRIKRVPSNSENERSDSRSRDSRERDRSRRDSPRDRDRRDRERDRDRDPRRRDRDDDRRSRRERGDRDRDRDRKGRDDDRRDRSKDADRSRSSPMNDSGKRSKKRSLSPGSKDDTKESEKKLQTSRPGNEASGSKPADDIDKISTGVATASTTAMGPTVPMSSPSSVANTRLPDKGASGPQPLFPVIPPANTKKGLLGEPPSNIAPLIPGPNFPHRFPHPGNTENRDDKGLPRTDDRGPRFPRFDESRGPAQENQAPRRDPRRSRFDEVHLDGVQQGPRPLLDMHPIPLLQDQPGSFQGEGQQFARNDPQFNASRNADRFNRNENVQDEGEWNENFGERRPELFRNREGPPLPQRGSGPPFGSPNFPQEQDRGPHDIQNRSVHRNDQRIGERRPALLATPGSEQEISDRPLYAERPYSGDFRTSQRIPPLLERTPFDDRPDTYDQRGPPGHRRPRDPRGADQQGLADPHDTSVPGGPRDFRGPRDSRASENFGPYDPHGHPDARGPPNPRGPPDFRGQHDPRGLPDQRGPLDPHDPDSLGPPDPRDFRRPFDQRGLHDSRGPPFQHDPFENRDPLDHNDPRGPHDLRASRGPHGPPGHDSTSDDQFVRADVNRFDGRQRRPPLLDRNERLSPFEDRNPNFRPPPFRDDRENDAFSGRNRDFRGPPPERDARQFDNRRGPNVRGSAREDEQNNERFGPDFGPPDRSYDERRDFRSSRDFDSRRGPPEEFSRTSRNMGRGNKPPFENRNNNDQQHGDTMRKQDDGPPGREERVPHSRRGSGFDSEANRSSRNDEGGKDRDRRRESTGDSRDRSGQRFGNNDSTTALCSVMIDNMTKETKHGDIRKFFGDCDIPKNHIKLINDEQGNRTGKAYVRFANQDSYKRALQMHRLRLNSSHVIIKPVPGKEYDDAIDSYQPDTEDGNTNTELRHSLTATLKALKNSAGVTSPEKKDFVVKLGQLPPYATPDHIKTFFNSCEIANNGEALYIEFDRRGRCTGECFVEFANEKSYKSAMSQRRQFENTPINIEPGSKREIEAFTGKSKREMDGEQKESKSKDSDSKEGSVSAKTEIEEPGRVTLDPGPKLPAAMVYLRIQNISKDTKKYEIRSMFDGLGIFINSVQIPHDAVGKPVGEAFVEFSDSKSVEKAMTRSNEISSKNKVVLTPISKSQTIDLLRSFKVALQPELPTKQDVFYFVKAANLPINVTTGELMTFFAGYNPAPESMRLNISDSTQQPDTSTALVGFRKREDAERAVDLVNQKILRQKPVTLSKVIL